MKKVKALKKAEIQRLHEELEAQVARDERSGHELEKLYEQMGTKREKVAQEEKGTTLTPAQIQQIVKDLEKLTQLLIAMGPKELIRLEKAVERLEADPRAHFDPKDIKDTVEKLKGFSAEMYQTANQIDEKFQREQLLEQIKLEKEKQKAITQVIHDLDTISKAFPKQ